MNKQLPERLDLEQLKKQAKDLLHEVRAGQADALVRIENENRETFALHDAQRILAREYGFESWPKLKLHVETRAEDAAERRLIDAVTKGEEGVLKALLQGRPALGRRSIAAVAVLGDLSGLQARLAGDPGRFTARTGTYDAEPLAYVCLGKLGGNEEARIQCTEFLLAGGGDANGSWLDRDWPDSRQPVLYAAVGRNNYPTLARLLLAAGALTNDGESIYHAAEKNHRKCLEALAAAGADFSSRHELYDNTPLYFLLGHVPGGRHAATVMQGIHWLLDHGADPNVPSYLRQHGETALHAAVSNGWPLEMIEAFLAHGADAARPRKDGRTALSLAERFGRADVAELFRRHGADAPIDSADQLLGACWRGDDAEVLALSAAHPGLGAKLIASEPDLLVKAAAKAPAHAIGLMLRVGFPLESVGSAGETAVLNAAWHGRAETVQLLVARGANVHHVETKYGGNAISWCSNGSLNCSAADGDYAAVAAALLAGGAMVAEKWRKVWEASPPVLEVLRRHGQIP